MYNGILEYYTFCFMQRINKLYNMKGPTFFFNLNYSKRQRTV